MTRIQSGLPGVVGNHRLPPARRAPSVVVIEDVTELEPYIPAWEVLATAALEPNVFYEPWMLLPAVREFGAGRRLLFVLVLDAGRLLGVFPFERGDSYPWLPVRTLRLWRHKHCYLGVPLVRADAAADCLEALFGWLAADRRGAALAEFPQLAAEGPFAALLTDYLDMHRRPTFLVDSFQRALLRPRKTGRPRPEEVLSGGRRKNLRAKERRLTEQGPLIYAAPETVADLETWIEEFLRCEASGWKARAGTALACSAADQAYFRTIVTAAWQRGRLIALALHCGGRAIALRCTFLAPEGAFAFKTAHDEAFADYTPGVLLEAETMFRLHALPAVDWVDSCTAPDNFLLNSLWPQRRTVQTVLAPTGNRLGNLAVRSLTALRGLKHKAASLRSFLRQLVNPRKLRDVKRPRRSDDP